MWSGRDHAGRSQRFGVFGPKCLKPIWLRLQHRVGESARGRITGKYLRNSVLSERREPSKRLFCLYEAVYT